MYNKDILRKYISDSWLRIYNERIKVRLSKELALKYDAGIYDKFLEEIDKGLQMLDGLNIKYPSNSMPILYIYVVLDDNFVELLNFPKTFAKGKNGGGKAVACYDLDGFNFAYGLSQNVLEKCY